MADTAATPDLEPLKPADWTTLSDEKLLEVRMCDLALTHRGHRAGAAHRAARRRARRPRPRVPAALLALRRVVHAGRRSGHRDPFLPGASAARKAGARADARGRRRRSRIVPSHPATRSGPRDRQRLPAAAPSHTPTAVRRSENRIPRVLHAEAVQQELRAASRSLVRAEPSGRGLRRNVRRLDGSRIDVGDALRGLAGAAEARIHGPADARSWPRCGRA